MKRLSLQYRGSELLKKWEVPITTPSFHVFISNEKLGEKGAEPAPLISFELEALDERVIEQLKPVIEQVVAHSNFNNFSMIRQAVENLIEQVEKLGLKLTELRIVRYIEGTPPIYTISIHFEQT
ncbi:MAG: hypothetical protein QXU69_11215 [Thermofilaceae archaeon]